MWQVFHLQSGRLLVQLLSAHYANEHRRRLLLPKMPESDH